MTDPLRAGALLHERFTLKRQLGFGGAATVWLASDGTDGRDVALKILHPKFRRRHSMVRRLVTEATVLGELDHPAIARPIAYFEDDGFASLAMELVEGRTLDGYLGELTQKRIFPPEAELTRFFQEICAGVAHAHDRDIIHRDLKPQNVMITERDGALHAKVLDFGIAKLLQASTVDATTQGRRIGSIFYMAPEQARGDPTDARTDVFALGSMLFELLTLRRAWVRDAQDRPVPAFDGASPSPRSNALPIVMARIASEARPRPSTVRPELPAALDEVVARATAIEPRERYASARALYEDYRAARSRIDLSALPTGADEGAPTHVARASEDPTKLAMRDVSIQPTMPMPVASRAQEPASVDASEREARTVAEVLHTPEILSAVDRDAKTVHAGSGLHDTAPLAPTPVRDTRIVAAPSAGIEATSPSGVVPSAIVRGVAGPSTARVAAISAAITAAVVLAAVAAVVWWLRARDVLVFTPAGSTSPTAATSADVTSAARATALPTASERPGTEAGNAAAERDPGLQDRSAAPTSVDARSDARRDDRSDARRDARPTVTTEARAQGEGASDRRPGTAAPLAALDRMMEALRADPRDLKLGTELGAAIAERAGLVKNDAKRARIQRIARASAMAGDVAGLELALSELRAEVSR
jgi:serine/threonine protein kinase